MIDLFLLRPGNTNAHQMKLRLAAHKEISLHEIASENEIAALRPPQDSIFIFHLSGKEDVRTVLAQILVLNRLGGPTVMNVVVSELKDAKIKQTIESLPQTSFYTTDRPAHEIDHLILKKARQQLAAKAPIRLETLKYENQKETFIAKERETTQTVKSEAVVIQPKAASQNKFRPVTETDQQRKLLEDALTSKANVVLSNYGFNDEMKGTFKGLDEKKKRVSLELKGPPPKIQKFRERTKESKKIALSIALKQSRVFFVSIDYTWPSDETIELNVPSLVYFVQRRKDFRLLIHPTDLIRIRFELGGEMIEFPIYDISASGVSVLWTPEEDARFGALLEIPQTQLLFETNDWKTGPLKFRQKQAFSGVNGEPLVKAGFSFERIPTVYKKQLGDYVDRKARAYVLNYGVES